MSHVTVYTGCKVRHVKVTTLTKWQLSGKGAYKAQSNHFTE